MGKLTHDFKYSVDSKLGQYGFYYDTVASEYKYVFKYWTDPRFGQYVFYYDMIKGGSLKYIFKYPVNPTFGSYPFVYSPLESAYKEDSIVVAGSVENNTSIISNSNSSILENVRINETLDSFGSFLDAIETRFISESKVKTPSNFLERENTTKEIPLADFVSILFYESIAQNNLLISDEGVFASMEHDLEITTSTNHVPLSDKGVKTLNEIDGVTTVSHETNRDMFIRTVSHGMSTVDVVAKLREDEVLMEQIKRGMHINRDTPIHREDYSTEIEEQTPLDKIAEEVIIDEEKVLNHVQHHLSISGEVDKDVKILKPYRFKDLSVSEGVYTAERTTKELGDVEDSSEILMGYDTSDREPRNIEITEMEKQAVKDSGELTLKENEVLVGKGSDSLSPINGEVSILKSYKKIALEEGIQVNKGTKDTSVEKDQLIDKDSKDISMDKDTLLKKDSKDILVDKDTLLEKDSKEMLVEKEFMLKKESNDLRVEERDFLNRELNREIKVEIDERLDLHKRFWFLKSIGEMDYKILPNTDFKYPPTIEIFDEEQVNGVYVYKYSDKFKELGSYQVRLYKEDLTILSQHDVMYIKDYDNSMRDIRVKTRVRNLTGEDEYKYEVFFEVYINIDEADYMVIKQPKGFKGSEFVFVASEKFMADNHPIPLGEDLGLREIPVSIAIMVDFMNILLLLWSKRLLAFSGMTGTQAVTGMSKLVHQWITLDTSLEAESIEDYNRCYRWFRWESEKVYNRAKQDPNLRGNYWIEEVIFEMIDYLEMHHFNKMPEWDMVLMKMDEQRDIFNDPQFDIPIVLDKFKGIRKRAIIKNKRMND